jgi:hypothetical protein
MHLGVFVDLTIDRDQQAGTLQSCQVIMQIRIVASGFVQRLRGSFAGSRSFGARCFRHGKNPGK